MQSPKAGKYFTITFWLQANILNCVLFFHCSFRWKPWINTLSSYKIIILLGRAAESSATSEMTSTCSEELPLEIIFEEKKGTSNQDTEGLKEFSHMNLFTCPIAVWHPNPKSSNFPCRKPNQLSSFPFSSPQQICSSVQNSLSWQNTTIFLPV